MVLGLNPRTLILAFLVAAFVIPKRTTAAGKAVSAVGAGFSSALSSVASPRIEPVFNPTIGISGNIGESFISRFTGDDPTGEPQHQTIPITEPQIETYPDDPYGGGQATLRRLLTSDDLYGYP